MRDINTLYVCMYVCIGWCTKTNYVCHSDASDVGACLWICWEEGLCIWNVLSSATCSCGRMPFLMPANYDIVSEICSKPISSRWFTHGTLLFLTSTHATLIFSGIGSPLLDCKGGENVPPEMRTVQQQCKPTGTSSMVITHRSALSQNFVILAPLQLLTVYF